MTAVITIPGVIVGIVFTILVEAIVVIGYAVSKFNKETDYERK
jgi:hypothetical protein